MGEKISIIGWCLVILIYYVYGGDPIRDWRAYVPGHTSIYGQVEPFMRRPPHKKDRILSQKSMNQLLIASTLCRLVVM